MEQEEAIILERISISEAGYRRLSKRFTQLLDETPSGEESINDMRKSLNAELDIFEILLKQLQLQLNMNEEETQKYEDRKRQGNIRVQELTQKSGELQEALAVAQVIRAQKEELSAMVDEMVKAKKVMLDEGDRKVPIIALLNTSRAEDEKLNESLIEEIAELEAQKAKYQALWDSRRGKFDELSEFVEEFKTDMIRRAKGGAEREAEGTRDATPFDDIEEDQQDGEDGNEQERDDDNVQDEREGDGYSSTIQSSAATPTGAAEESEDVEMANS